MGAAGIFLGAILIGGFIAIATGVIAVAGLLQALRGTGLRREPPLTTTSIAARQRAVDARLRARYLARRPPTAAWEGPVSATIEEGRHFMPVPEAPALAAEAADQAFAGPFVDGLAS
jgi:hypothetical protein